MLEKLGKYPIKSELGKGASGIVYEGFDPFIKRAVAIKVIQKSTIDESDDKNAFKRFLREAQAAGKLSHPNIISVYEYGEENELAFIAMEFAEGPDLKKCFDDGQTFSIGEAINITLQLLRALDYSHRHNVVHRDIKPSNILFTGNQQVKVSDFGIAKIESSQLTQTGALLGTPMYMSPEQIQGVDTDRRTDIYSVGVILYQMLTNTTPFSGSLVSMMYQVMHRDIIAPRILAPDVSEELSAIVLKAMARQPEQRYPTAADFLNALTSISIPEADTRNFRKSERSEETTLHIQVHETISELSRQELSLWLSVKNSKHIDDFKRYLTAYPNGDFAESAKLHISALEEKAPPQQALTEEKATSPSSKNNTLRNLVFVALLVLGGGLAVHALTEKSTNTTDKQSNTQKTAIGKIDTKIEEITIDEVAIEEAAIATAAITVAEKAVAEKVESEAEKTKVEKAEVDAAKARAEKATAEAAKTKAEKMAAEAAKAEIEAAKARAEKAEAEKAEAEAEAAKAKAERAKAEKAEAEAAKARAEKAEAEAAKAKAEAEAALAKAETEKTHKKEATKPKTPEHHHAPVVIPTF